MNLSFLILSLKAGFIASLVWFVIGGVLYMNPLVAGFYKKNEKHPGVKKWANVKEYLLKMYVFGTLVQCLIFALAYSFISPILPGNILSKTLIFGLILIGIKIYPRFSDMWLQANYPNELLLVEFINGTIGSFVIAFILTLLI